MNISLTPEALNWVKREFAPNGKYIRIYVKYGQSAMHPGFTLGMTVENPRLALGTSKLIDEVTLYVTEDDMWYFGGRDLTIGFNEKSEDVIFSIK